MDSAHASALQNKHSHLDEQLRAERGRPAPDAGLIQELKRRKLRIKEELAQL